VSRTVFVRGIGAVSPAGWDVAALRNALTKNQPAPVSDLARPHWKKPLKVRRINGSGPAMAHPRLRRVSPISTYAATAALEALGEKGIGVAHPRLGIIVAVTSGCVQFSRRFYDEAWKQPATASPLIFPETVFNAPASHLSAILQSQAPNYTLVGDPGTFLQGLAIAADWLADGKADGCLVVGAEEIDWLTADAQFHFARGLVCSEGAGAVCLTLQPPIPGAVSIELAAVTDSYLYLDAAEKNRSLVQVRKALAHSHKNCLLCDSRTGVARRDAAETEAWQSWSGPRISPQMLMGDGLGAGAAWQCVAAIDQLQQNQADSALVSVAGTHRQAIGACFAKTEARSQIHEN
jgi:hypothetical protein